MQRHVDCRPQQVEGKTVREALDAAFATNTKARGYVLDERGALRRHMVIFVSTRKGLPQVDAYDIVFRHALDIDETGDQLAFGSTTGSLWVSDDQGDSWSTLSQNLPPVYSVRFA
jgi:hypothetical protein